jgi:hypothetical protein
MTRAQTPTSKLIAAIDSRLNSSIDLEDRHLYLQIRDRLMEQSTEITKLKVVCRQTLNNNREIAAGLQFVKSNLKKISSSLRTGKTE